MQADLFYWERLHQCLKVDILRPARRRRSYERKGGNDRRCFVVAPGRTRLLILTIE